MDKITDELESRGWDVTCIGFSGQELSVEAERPMAPEPVETSILIPSENLEHAPVCADYFSHIVDQYPQ